MTSIASQLQAIKSAVKGAADPVRRPATRPSVLFDPKEAADLDLRSILVISFSGLEVLVQLDPQFGWYRKTLFSHTSLEIDRERMKPQEEVELNKNIVLFLGLLAGHLNLSAAEKTLEYLIRRYRIHVHNEEELIMCALPYHDTHAFVRIVQLLELRNKKWAFLEGVKASGAPPPRRVIVQQCIRDNGVLETLCNYASPMNKASLMKNFQQSRPVICFCSTVIIEALGSVPKLDHDSVERVLTFVKPQLKGSRDHKAGALMVVGLLATRATLEAKVVQNLILSIAKVAQHDARQSEDSAWLRIVILAILSLVQQMHTTQLFSKKITIALNKIGDLVGILSGLSLEFNIQNFLGLYVESLVDYSKTDDSCLQTLINAIKTLSMKDIIDKIAMRVIAHFVNLQSGRASISNEAGIWERILVIIDKHYPSDLRRAVRKHLETCMMKSQEQESTFSSFRQIFGEYLELPMDISDSKIWFSLEHPKAAVRQSTLSAIATSNVVKHMAANPEKLKNVQYAILQRLHDEDLSVIQTALTIDGLSEIIDPTSLLSAYHDVLVKCTDIIDKNCCVEVQVESLSSFASICSRFALSERTITDKQLPLLLGFPSLLIPLANENKDIRAAAVNCVEVIGKLRRSFDASRLKNGNDAMLRIILSPTFVDFVEAIVSQKQLIISDVNFLPMYLASMLSQPSSSLLVPVNTHKRFDQPAKGAILRLIMSSTLKLSSYGKIMVLSLLKGVGNAMLDVKKVKSLLFKLLKRRKEYHCRIDKSHQELSTVEIKILCLLLEISLTVSGSAGVAADVLDRMIVEGPYSEDPTVVEPYVTVMENLTSGLYDTLKPEMQDKLLRQLILLFRSDNGNVRNTARETLLRVNIFSSVARFLRMIVDYDQNLSKLTRRGKASIRSCSLTREDSFNKVETIISLSSLLDILLLKKDIEKGDSLVEPLFRLLGKLFSNGWLVILIGQSDGGSGVLSQVPETITGAIYYAQQTTLIILKDFIDSLLLECSLKDDVLNKSHVDLLIECARSTEDNATRNHIFMLLSSVAKIFSGRLAEHITDIFTIIGESAVMQSDSHSQNVLEDLIATLVPYWLTKVDSKADSIEKLLQIFINASPEIAEHRRVALMVYLLRTLGENTSFDLLVAHLLRSLITRLYKSSELERNINDLLSSPTIFGEWEYTFALQLCDQYSCKVWFPCLVKLLQHIRLLTNPDEQVYELYLSMNFIIDKLQDTELVFALESGQDADYLQDAFVELMEQVVLHLQVASARSRQLPLSSGFLKVLMECANKILNTITRWMVPSKYFKGITQLLDHPDAEVKKKTLKLLSETMKDHSSAQNKSKHNKKKQRFSSFLLHERDSNFFNEMCLKIVHLVDSTLDESEIPLKVAALSSIEVLTKVLPSGNGIYVTCLACIVKHIASADLAISSSCLRTVSALISILQSKSLPQLPNIMKHLLERAHEISPCPIGKKKSSDSVTSDGIASFKVSVLISILTTLEAVVENLAGFVNPYLEDILNLVVLHPEYALDIDLKLKVKATSVRKLLAERIPARLLLSPLLRTYANAVECGKSNLSLALEMIASMVSGMDRSSIVSYHTKIYEQCLLALDLRRQHPESLKDISMVEESVIHAMIVLTLKLTETTFRPLFLHSLEWAESEIETSESTKGRSIDRAISFYKLVNKLIEHHRSLFVPYFKYLLDGCTRYLTENQDDDSTTLAPKRKKAKIGNSQNRAKDKGGLPQKMWHLRALILKSLHKCFLYDTTDLKFLDSSNFQVLLKPIVSQLVVDPPASLELSSDLPTVEEVDESLVLCLGQMALTACSDVLWKPLNHEVLMQTRNEKVRPKILGLKVVKYFVEHLKEEYLVFLAESIPYLGELLEDVELPVKSLAQEILKEMELLSGESLRQYL